MSIFTQTTSLKSDLAITIIDLLEKAGWNNVSSNYSTDFYVMNSKGETGDKDLYFQFRPTSTTNTNDVTSTTATIMSYRLINGYTPNETDGVAGTFARTTSEAWRTWQIAQGTTVDPAVELNLWFSINKDRAIFNIYTPESLSLLPTLFYIGLPTSYTSEPLSRGVVAYSSMTSSFSNVAHVSDNVPELPTSATSITLANQIVLPPKSPNSAGIHTPVELSYGNASVGLRGKLDSLFFLPANSINDGNILKQGNKRFRATQLGVVSNNSFPTNCVIYQIS